MRLLAALCLLLLAPAATAQMPQTFLTVDGVRLDDPSPMDAGETRTLSFEVTRHCGSPAQVLEPASLSFTFSAHPQLALSGSADQVFPRQTCASQDRATLSYHVQVAYLGGAEAPLENGTVAVLPIKANGDYSGGSAVSGYASDPSFTAAVPVNTTAPAALAAAETVPEKPAPTPLLALPALALAALALRRRL
jgi:MYXO-CTERM domain-containing protein